MNFKNLITIAVLIAFLSACGAAETPAPKAEAQTFTLKREMIAPTLELSGTLEANRETPVAAKMAGRIMELSADIGDKVFEGQILGQLAGDESAVNAETARLNEANTKTVYIAQKQFLDSQVANAEKALELAETNYKAVNTAKGETSLSTTEQIKLAEKSVELAQVQVDNATSLANQRIETLYKNAKSAIRNALIAITNANNFADTVLGVSREKEHLNDAYENNLGALDSNSKLLAKIALQNAIQSKNGLKTLYDTNIENQNPSNDAYDSYLQTTLDALELTQAMLNQIYTMLDRSASGGDFSENKLQALKQENLTHGQNVEAATLTIAGGVKLGVKGLLLTRDEVFTQNQAEKNNAEAGLLQAQQALNQIKASSGQARSGVQSQKTIALKQVEQAKAALESAKTQRDSALKGLEQQMDLVSGNKKLSDVTLQNTVINAPFSGIITEKTAEVGQVVAPGQAVFSVADVSAFKIKTDVPDTAIKDLTLGTQAEVRIDGLNGTLSASVSKIYPKVDPQTRKLGIELTLNEKPENAKVGMFTRITMKFSEREAYFVPKSFVFSDFDGAFIKLKTGEKKPVTLGQERDGKVKIWFEGEMEGKVMINE